MELPIQKIHPDATLPSYAHPGDAGMDMYACASVTINPGQRVSVPTGIAMAVPQGHVALVWDKSGRALNDGLTTMAGVIDAGYRGEVQIVLLNTGSVAVIIEPGQKIAQILIQPVVSVTIQEQHSLNDTSRGSDGFGSTGI